MRKPLVQQHAIFIGELTSTFHGVLRPFLDILPPIHPDFSDFSEFFPLFFSDFSHFSQIFSNFSQTLPIFPMGFTHFYTPKTARDDR